MSSIVNCQHCKGQASSEATRCPHCQKTYPGGDICSVCKRRFQRDQVRMISRYRTNTKLEDHICLGCLSAITDEIHRASYTCPLCGTIAHGEVDMDEKEPTYLDKEPVTLFICRKGLTTACANCGHPAEKVYPYGTSKYESEGYAARDCFHCGLTLFVMFAVREKPLLDSDITYFHHHCYKLRQKKGCMGVIIFFAVILSILFSRLC